MTHACRHCGEELDRAALRCSRCGTAVTDGSDVDYRAQRVHELLAQARQAQQDGQLDAALRAAREALALRAASSEVHALLGHLYELQGDAAAARYHFRAALDVVQAVEAEGSFSEVAHQKTPTRRAHGTWMGLIVIGCILFSGLATLVTFWAGERHVDHGSVFQVQMKRAVAQRTDVPLKAPRWDWHVPTPAMRVLPSEAPVATHDDTPMPVKSREVPRPVPAVDNPAIDASPQEDPVLGPSARRRMTAAPALTLEQADQAFFRGEHERAVTMYEAIIHRDEHPNPRVYRDLAWCYQRLGNSPKAAEHLEKAIAGYQDLVASEPENPSAQEHLVSCQTALRTLLTSRNRLTVP